MMRKLLFATALVGSSLGVSAVHAGDAATAEALFREGKALMDAGNYQAACPKLEESYSQDPGTGTLLALALCQEHAGLTASAWATYAEVATRAKADNRTDREQAARDHMAALEPKLSHLTIEVDGSAATLRGLQINRDGRAVGAAAWGTAMPVDPGDHVVEASAPGKLPFQAHVTVKADADAQTIRVPALADDAAAKAEGAPQPFGGSAAVDTGTSGSGVSLRTVGLIVGGAGIVGLGVSGLFAVRARSLNDESKADGHCDAQNQCDPIGGEKRDDAKSAATIATVMLVAGGVLTATGVTLFIVGKPKKSEAAAARVEASPVVGVREAAVVLRGRF